LRHHWLEEAQHTTLDTLIVEQLVQDLDPTEVEAGVEDFFKIIEFLNGGLMMQVQLDLGSLSRAAGRSFTEVELKEIQMVQEQSYRWTFIGSGISHGKFVQTFNQVSPSSQERLTAVAQKYSQ
jgi:hypothetical protein